MNKVTRHPSVTTHPTLVDATSGKELKGPFSSLLANASLAVVVRIDARVELVQHVALVARARIVGMGRVVSVSRANRSVRTDVATIAARQAVVAVAGRGVVTGPGGTARKRVAARTANLLPIRRRRRRASPTVCPWSAGANASGAGVAGGRRQRGTTNSSSDRLGFAFEAVNSLVAAREGATLTLIVAQADSRQRRSGMVHGLLVVNLVDRNRGVDDGRLDHLLLEDRLNRLVHWSAARQDARSVSLLLNMAGDEGRTDHGGERALRRRSGPSTATER